MYELDKMLPGVMANWCDGDGCHWCHRDTREPMVGHDGLCPVPALFALNEDLRYELKMETIRVEHAESDIGGVREEQWYEVRNKELEAEIERLRDECAKTYAALVVVSDKEDTSLPELAEIIALEVKQLRAKLDDIQECKNGFWYCAWAERLARENDRLRETISSYLTIHDLQFGFDGGFAPAFDRAVNGLRAVLQKQVVDSGVGVDHNEDKP